jgi:hypothetical protein
MTLSQFLSHPLPDTATLQTLAIVFDTTLAQKMIDAHAWYGDQRYGVHPGATADGRWFHVADILTQCIAPAGIYAAGFSRLDTQNFSLVQVVPLSSIEIASPPPVQLSPNPQPVV